MRATLTATFLCIAIAACNRTRSGSPRHDAGVATAPSAAATTSAAASPPAAVAGAKADAGSPRPENLLHIVPSRIEVSSTVDNPRDFPEHLVDGRVDTAWNGKSGDLVGAWIKVKVPRDARVDAILMNCGFDKRTAKEDLFTANHRIKRVAVFRGGARLREVTLDVTKRGLQRIPIDADGGAELRIEVLETVAGTRASWKEIVVSELVVVGQPGKERRAASDPLRVAVGTGGERPDPQRLERSRGVVKAHPSVAELCAAAAAEANAEAAEAIAAGVPAATCTEVPAGAALAGDATYRGVHVVRITNPNIPGMHEDRWVLELARGFVLTPVVVGLSSLGCPTAWWPEGISSVYTENGHIVAVVDGAISGMKSAGDRERLSRGLAWCSVTGSRLDCAQYSPQLNPPLAEKTRAAGSTEPWAKIAWKVFRKVQVSKAGKLEAAAGP